MSLVFESLLNRECRAWRPARSEDGQGGWLISYTLVGTVQGRLRPMTGSEMTQAAQEQRQISHRLYVTAADAVGSQIGRGWLVDDGTDAFLVEVLGIQEPSRAGEHLEIDCWQRQLGEGEILVGS